MLASGLRDMAWHERSTDPLSPLQQRIPGGMQLASCAKGLSAKTHLTSSSLISRSGSGELE